MPSGRREYSPILKLADKVESHAIQLALDVDDLRAQLNNLDEISGTVPAVITSYFATLKLTLEIIADEIEASEQSLGITASQIPKPTVEPTQTTPKNPPKAEIRNVPTSFFSPAEIEILANRIDRSNPPRKEWDRLRLSYAELKQITKPSFRTTEPEENAFEANLIAARRNRSQLSPMETELLRFYDQYCRDLYS